MAEFLGSESASSLSTRLRLYNDSDIRTFCAVELPEPITISLSRFGEDEFFYYMLSGGGLKGYLWRKTLT